MADAHPYQDIQRWIETPRNAAALDALDPEEILPQNIKEWPKIIGTLLTHYLKQSDPSEHGYRALSLQAFAKTLATTIHGWQENPERETPYHPLLIKSWLSGEQLISQQAFLGIMSYLRDTNTLSQTQAKAFQALRDVIEETISEKKPLAMNETTQTARAMMTNAQISLTEVVSQLDSNKPNVSKFMTGEIAIPFKHIPALDAMFKQKGMDGLLDGHVQRNCEESTRAFEDTKSFGPLLTATREHAMLSQRELANSVGIPYSLLNFFENQKKKPNGDAIYPTAKTVSKIITAIKAREEKLQAIYPDAYTPLLTEDNAKRLTAAATLLRGERNSFEKIDRYTPELLAEIAVLRIEGVRFKDIVELLELNSLASCQDAFKKSEFSNLELSAEERSGATERLRAKLNIKGTNLAKVIEEASKNRITKIPTEIKIEALVLAEHKISFRVIANLVDLASANAVNGIVASRRTSGIQLTSEERAAATQRIEEKLGKSFTEIIAEATESSKPRTSLGAVQRGVPTEKDPTRQR